MADLLPDGPATQGARWPRDWQVYEQYQIVHENSVASLIAEGVIARNTVRFLEARTRSGSLVEVNVRGRIETRARGVLTVNKWLVAEARRDGRVVVRTREYDYHAYVRVGEMEQDVFRYDNCHGAVDTLHRHVYDVGGREVSRRPIQADENSVLGVIVRETEFLAEHLNSR